MMLMGGTSVCMRADLQIKEAYTLTENTVNVITGHLQLFKILVSY
jgi:hypothetical protein